MSDSISSMSPHASLLFSPDTHFSLPYIAEGKLSFVSVSRSEAVQISESADRDPATKRVAQILLQGWGRVDATIMAARSACNKLQEIASPKERLDAEVELRNFVLRVQGKVRVKLDSSLSVLWSSFLGGLGGLSRVENALNEKIRIDTPLAQTVQVDYFKPYCHIMSPVDAVTALKNDQVAPQISKGFILRMDPNDPAMIHLVVRVKRPGSFEIHESTIVCTNGTYRLLLDDHDPEHMRFREVAQWTNPIALMEALKLVYGEPILLSSPSSVSAEPPSALPAAALSVAVGASVDASGAQVAAPAPVLVPAPAPAPAASAQVLLPQPPQPTAKDALIGRQLDILLPQLPKGICKTRSKQKAVDSITRKMKLIFEKEGGVEMLQYDKPPYSSNNKAFTLRREGNAIFLIEAEVDLESRAVQTSEIDVTSILILEGVPEEEASIDSFLPSLSTEYGVPVTDAFSSELRRRIKKTVVPALEPEQPVLQAVRAVPVLPAAAPSTSVAPIASHSSPRIEERIGGCLVHSGFKKDDLEFQLKQFERHPEEGVKKAFLLYREKDSSDSKVISVMTATYGFFGKATISTVTPEIRQGLSGAYTLRFQESELDDSARNLIFTTPDALAAKLKELWGRAIEY